MTTLQVDVAIVGAGTAGLTARREALKHGARRVVLIEGGPYGTTCARVGCMPSKLLISAADLAFEASHAANFGIDLPEPPRIDGRAVMARVQRERDRFVGFVVDSVESLPAEQRLRGWARFAGPSALVVTGEDGAETRVEAGTVVVAVGSRPRIPPILAALDSLGDRVLTNEHVFELDDLPTSLAVLGTGVIGLELGQAMHRLGVRTAIFGRSHRVGPIACPTLQRTVREVLGAELDLRLGTSLTGARTGEGGVELSWTDAEGRAHSEFFERVLVAAGRVSNIDRLGIEAAELAVDERGVPSFDGRTMQCGDRPVFIAGDVTGERTILHEAADEGRVAGANAAMYPEVRAHCRRTPLSIVFTDPQMAVVGEPGSTKMCKNGMGEVSYDDQGRARVMGKNRGVVRVYAGEPRAELIGAEMFGPRVEHTAHLLAWAVQSDMTVEQALQMPFYHPVVEEGIRTALRNLAANLKLDAKPLPLDCGPGD
ncbi:dihydrolipoyl dehydrogenase [Haliangium sp.]|uniref:dihydrolipoyl dehydrogenase n=1 Tax=Haliangium sp. TaxID=2663208 RepID=UPI003D0B81A7